MAGKLRPDVTALLSIIEEHAPKLIAAGVRSVALEGLSVSLADSVPSKDDNRAPTPDKIQPTHIDPLRDASTYPGGRIPGFTREEDLP